jgi:hypothetical protein
MKPAGVPLYIRIVYTESMRDSMKGLAGRKDPEGPPRDLTFSGVPGRKPFQIACKGFRMES